MNYDAELRDDPDQDTSVIRDTATSPDRRHDKSAISRKLIAQRRLAVRSIFLPYDPQIELEDALDEMLEGAATLREAGLPQPAVHLLADSFSGKSTAARAYVSHVSDRCEHKTTQVPVVYAKLDTDGTVGSLATDILIALGEPRPNALTPERRWLRAREALRKHEVSLLILDEFQRAGRRPTISPVIAGKILDIMDDGNCACAFLGKNNAINVFNACPDLKNRLDAPVRMPPLRWTTDRSSFMAFADAFDDALVKAGVTKFKSGLGEEETAQLLLEASNGLIGQFSRIIETAVIMITRDGNDAITRQDLEDAVQEWAIGNDRISYNPFTRQIGTSCKSKKLKSPDDNGSEYTGSDSNAGTSKNQLDLDDDDGCNA